MFTTSRESSSKATKQGNREELNLSRTVLDQKSSGGLGQGKSIILAGKGNNTNVIHNSNSSDRSGLPTGNTGTTTVTTLSPSFQADPTRSSVTLTPVRKPPSSQVPSSISKTPSSTAVNRTTSGRGFFKKLFGTPSSKHKKEVVVSPTSISQDKHIGKSQSSSSNKSTTSSLYGAHIDSVASSSSETPFSYTSGTNTTSAAVSGPNVSRRSTTNHPTLSRSLLEVGSNNFVGDFHRNRFEHRDEKVDRMKAPVPLSSSGESCSSYPSSPVESSGYQSRNPKEDGLSGPTLLPGHDDLDMLFLPHSSSSSDMFDEGNENYDFVTSTRTPERNGIDRHPMKTPGLAIPTPAYSKGSVRLDAAGEYHHTSSSISSNLRDVDGTLPFSNPLRSITESPVRRDDRPSQSGGETNSGVYKHQLNQLGDEQQMDDTVSLPDDAFLPDDFKQNTQGTVDTLTMDEVESRIQREKVAIRQELNEHWEQKIKAFQEEAEKILIDHGRAWKQEADAESDRLKALLKEEKCKTAKNHHELLMQSQKIEEMMGKLEQSEADLENLQQRIAASEGKTGRGIDEPNQTYSVGSKDDEPYMNQTEDGISSLQEDLDALHLTSINGNESQGNEGYNGILHLERKLASNSMSDQTKSLQDANDELNRQILAMQKEVDELREEQIVSSNREELVILKGEKAAADRQILDLTQRLRVRTESSNDALQRLEEAENEITSLRGQLMDQSKLNSSVISGMSDSSLENLFAPKAELEKLRSLREQDIQEKEDLKSQLEHVEEMRRRELNSPGSRSVTIASSPHVDELQATKELQKAREQLQAMGNVLKRYKTERDDIKLQMTALEQRQVQAIEIAVKHATKESKEKVQTLTEEIDKIRKESAQMTAIEIDELTAQVEEMNRRHEDEVVKLKEESANLMQQAKSESEKQLEETKVGLSKRHETEMAAFQRTIEELRLQNHDEIESAISKSKEEAEIEIRHLQDKIRQMKIEFENEKIELIQTTSKDIEELEKQIKKMNQKNDEEVQLIRSEARDEIQDLREQIEKLHKELDAKLIGSYSEEYVSELKSKFDDDIMDVKSKTKSEMETVRLTLESTIAEREEAIKNATKLQSQVAEIQERLTAKSEQDKSDFERLLRELRQEHAKESDELLEQLDLVEAEHNERYNKLQVVVRDKETVISAMGSQLADSESRCAGTSKKLDLLNREVETLKILLQEATADVDASKQEILKLSEEHSLAMENQAVLREKACEEAREEMIQLAEKQFEERQEMYRTLKNRFDNSTSKISVLERDLRFAKKETEELKKRQEGREADLKDELAQAKAALASNEANMIRTEKAHLVELEKAKLSEDQMRSKLEESQVVCDGVQRTLASLVAEKERLTAELFDMKQMCEELMAMVEGQSGG